MKSESIFQVLLESAHYSSFQGNCELITAEDFHTPVSPESIIINNNKKQTRKIGVLSSFFLLEEMCVTVHVPSQSISL